MSEEWVDEDKLELWEIKQYGERCVLNLFVYLHRRCTKPLQLLILLIYFYVLHVLPLKTIHTNRLLRVSCSDAGLRRLMYKL